MHLLCSKGHRALGICQGGATQVLCSGVFCGGEVQERIIQLVQLSIGFQSFPPLLTSKLGPSGADSQVGGFVYVLGP